LHTLSAAQLPVSGTGFTIKVVVAVAVTTCVSVTVCVVELHPIDVTTKGVDALCVAVPTAVVAWLACPVV
jgi:hypothetical protein